MRIVPENKTVYWGARRFIEGDILPPYVCIDFPEMTPKEAEKNFTVKERPKRVRKSKSRD